MKNWSRLILPIGLGIVAAMMNMAAMKTRLTPVTVVSVSRAVQVGEQLQESDLLPVEISYPHDHIAEHFWLWEERTALLIEPHSPCRLSEGDLLPRSGYRRWQRPDFPLTYEATEIGRIIEEDTIAPDSRHLIRPGRPAQIELADGTTLPRVLITELRPTATDPDHPVYELRFQMPTKGADYHTAVLSIPISSVRGLIDTEQSGRGLLGSL